jgi:hypothetical protein
LLNKKLKNIPQINIICIIGRLYQLGYKDIDHLLPFFYFLEKNKKLKVKTKILIQGNNISFNYKKPIQTFLSNLKNIEIKFRYEGNFFYKILSLFFSKKNSKAFSIFDRLVNNLILKFNLTKDKKNINWKTLFGESFINSKNLIFISLQHDNKQEKYFSSIKKYNKKAKWLVVPEGTLLCQNEMDTIYDLDKKKLKSEYKWAKSVDYFFSTCKTDLNRSISNGLERRKGYVIGSPRYCQDWLELKSKFKLDGKDVSINKKYKVKILFLAPKGFINIFTEELIRTIDFISSYNEIELIFLNNNYLYPKIPNSITSRDNIRFYYVSKQYSTSKLIEWADIVFHAGTGVVYQSFMKEKITVFPKYLTCNTLYSDVYNAGYNLSNRDELRNLCNAAVKSLNSLKKEYKKKTNFSNQKFIKHFVYGNNKSVPKTIQNSFLRVSQDL